MKKRAADLVALYKRLRQVIKEADVYHLTAPPAREDPTGWMALQYVTSDRKRSILMAYRLGASNPDATFRLHGLDERGRYQVREDQQPRGMLTGGQLSAQGFPVKLDAEWRATVIELDELSDLPKE